MTAAAPARAATTAAPGTTPVPSRADELQRIPLTQLRESPWNPRQHFDPAKLTELAESLRTQGQLAPIVVRPVFKVGKDGRAFDGYEIGAGHRRFRAAQQAGLTDLLAVVRQIGDVPFLELLVFENGNRNDLHPLEEAQGYRMMMERAGYDVAKIAARDGRSTKYVYDRIKLLQLTPKAKKLFLAGAFEAGHAILLARLTAAQQEQAIGDLEDVADSGEYAAHRVSLLLRPDHGAEGELPLHDRVKPVSVREFQHAIQHEIRATPEHVDSFLFPESAQALEAAKEERLSVIHITREHRVSDEARDEKVQTYGAASWFRADGAIEEDYRGRKVKSKTCDHSRYGFVVAGAGQGEVFRVCINKQKCKVHWPEHVKRAEAAKRRAKKAPTGKASAPKPDRFEQEEARRVAERAREEAEHARWKKALPQLRAALAAKVRTAPTGPTSVLGRAVLEACRLDYDQGWARNVMPLGRTADDVVRRAGWIALTGDLNEYRASSMVAAFKQLGIDAQAIVDAVAPKPVSEKKQPAKKAAKKKGKK